MSVRGVAAVASIESAKLAHQVAPRLVLAACASAPFAFCVVLSLQESAPTDTLFGRAAKESGFAAALVVLSFAALWVFPVLTSVVSGDLFAAEDRHRTWQTVLTRSRSRAEVFAGKVVTAVGFSGLAVAILAISSVAAGLAIVGSQPILDLSGVVRSPSESLARVTLAWTSVLPPAFAFTAFAVLLSVVTRSGAAAMGLPTLAALTMQLVALVDAPGMFYRGLITSAFGAWHGLLTEPPYYTPLIDGLAVSAACFVLCLAMAYRLIRRRDIGT